MPRKQHNARQLPLSRPAIRGRLETVGFAELAHLLRLSRRSGRLTLTQGPNRVELLLMKSVLRAISYLAATAELAHSLVSGKILRESVLQGLLARAEQDRAEPRRSFADAVLSVRGLEDGRVNEIISRLIEQAISRCTAWTVGCFSFHPCSSDELEAAVEQSDLIAPALSESLLPPAPSSVDRADLACQQAFSDELVLPVLGRLASWAEQGLVVIREKEQLRILTYIENRQPTTAPSHQLVSSLPIKQEHLGPLFDGIHTDMLERLAGTPVAAAPLVVLGSVQAVVCLPFENAGNQEHARLIELERLLGVVGFAHELRLLKRRLFGFY